MTQPHEEDLDRGPNRNVIDMCILIACDFLQPKNPESFSDVNGAGSPRKLR